MLVRDNGSRVADGPSFVPERDKEREVYWTLNFLDIAEMNLDERSLQARGYVSREKQPHGASH